MFITEHQSESMLRHEGNMRFQARNCRTLTFSVEWGQPQRGMVTLAATLLIVMLVWHARDISDVHYDKKAKVPFKSLFWTGSNVIVITCICIGFGKPYSVSYGSGAAFLCLSLCGIVVPSYYDWAEKLLSIIVMIVLIGEYFHLGFTNRGRIHGDPM